MVFPFWSIFSRGPKRLTFYLQVLWASESKLRPAPGETTPGLHEGGDLAIWSRLSMTRGWHGNGTFIKSGLSFLGGPPKKHVHQVGSDFLGGPQKTRSSIFFGGGTSQKKCFLFTKRGPLKKRQTQMPLNGHVTNMRFSLNLVANKNAMRLGEHVPICLWSIWVLGRRGLSRFQHPKNWDLSTHVHRELC